LNRPHEGIILFAHGSRDPQWAAPFERIAESLSRKHPDAATTVAYLELMSPTLHEAVAALAVKNVKTIRIVPLFLGQGGHVKEDLPKLVDAARLLYPGIAIQLDKAIGEQSPVIEAIAAVIAAGSA
jgi:sirohydrochlorin cobaltochelatase